MKKFGCVLSVALPFTVWAQTEEPAAATLESKVTLSGVEMETVIAAPLKGIVFFDKWDEVRRELVDPVAGIQVCEVQLLKKSPRFIRELIAEFIGEPLTEDTIAKLK